MGFCSFLFPSMVQYENLNAKINPLPMPWEWIVK